MWLKWKLHSKTIPLFFHEDVNEWNETYLLLSLSLWFGIAYIKREIANQIVLIGHYAVGILVWCDMIKTPILRKLLELLRTVTGSFDHSCARDLCQPSPKAAVGSREASVVQTVDMVDSLGTLGTS